MSKLAVYIRLEAKPGKEDALEALLQSAQAIVEQEPGTLSWYALKFGNNIYGIFDSFLDDDSRKTHLYGPLTTLLEDNADLMAEEPVIIPIDLIAVKGVAADAHPAREIH